MQICWHMQTADQLALQGDDVIDMELNAGQLFQTLSLDLELRDY